MSATNERRHERRVVKRPDDDQRIWAVVAATVRPLKGRIAPQLSAAETANPTHAPPTPPPARVRSGRSPPPAPPPPKPRGPVAPHGIEPNRLHRIDRGREPLAAMIDLHGLGQDAARRALEAFVIRHYEAHHRTLLVITGKGLLGDGVLRRRAPEWLAEPPLRAMVAGISEARRHKGGEGALYVALKRNPAPARYR